MNQTTVIVLERSGAWAAALRRLFDAAEVRVFETRTVDECRQRILHYPTAVAVLELTPANVAALVAMLVQMHDQAAELRTIVVANRQLAGYEDLLREAGAIHFLVSPRSLGDAAEIVRRRSVQLAAAATLEDDGGDPRPPILGNLPWPDMI